MDERASWNARLGDPYQVLEPHGGGQEEGDKTEHGRTLGAVIVSESGHS